MYKIWKVYEPGVIWSVKFYLVNMDTRKVHSAWDSYTDAIKTKSKLETWAKKGVI